MASVRRKKVFTKRRARTAGILGVLTLGTSLMAAPQTASAQESPTTEELLEACDWADLCEFHPQDYTTYQGKMHQVSETLYNCGTEVNWMNIGWSDTTATTHSSEITITASSSFFEIFSASVAASYGVAFETAHEDSGSVTVRVPAGSKGWIERGTAMQQVTGWYELHFEEPFYDHHVWYVHDYQADGYNPAGSDDIVAKDKPMTPKEVRRFC
jgi:hypothetical protein